MNAIDRFFDLVDSGVGHVDRVLNRGKQTAEQQRARKAQRGEIIEAEAPKPSRSKSSVTKSSSRESRATSTATSTALSRKSRFYIVESIEAGSTRFVVTDGGNARTECASRAFAEQILQALERTS